MPSKKSKLKQQQKNQSANVSDESQIGQETSQQGKSRQKDDYKSRY